MDINVLGSPVHHSYGLRHNGIIMGVSVAGHLLIRINVASRQYRDVKRRFAKNREIPVLLGAEKRCAGLFAFPQTCFSAMYM